MREIDGWKDVSMEPTWKRAEGGVQISIAKEQGGRGFFSLCCNDSSDDTHDGGDQ